MTLENRIEILIETKESFIHQYKEGIKTDPNFKDGYKQLIFKLEIEVEQLKELLTNN